MKKIYAPNIPKLVSSRFNFTNNVADNIDLAFEYETYLGDSEKSLLRARGIPIIGGSRLTKIQQTIVLKRFMITHPKTFYTNTFECINTIDDLNSYVDLDEFVVKPILGARGVGVKKITRSEFKDCLTNSINVDKIFHEEKEFLRKNDDCSSSFINNSINCMLIQEPIEIKHEFRIIFFQPDNLLGYERVRSSNTEFCGNLSHGSTAKPISDQFMSKYILPQSKYFRNLMEEFKYPFLSVDLYVDKNDTVGCFEFQMEFAYEGFNHIQVREFMTESLLNNIR